MAIAHRFALLCAVGAAAAMAGCGSSATSPTPSPTRAVLSAPVAPLSTASPSPTVNAGAPLDIANGVTVTLPSGWKRQDSGSGPIFLISADSLTHVLLQNGLYTGDGPPPSSAADDMNEFRKDAEQPGDGWLAKLGVQISNVQVQPGKTSRAGAWNSVAERDYTATVNGKPVKGILQEFLCSDPFSSVFLMSISSPDVTFSNGVNNMLAQISSSHPTGD